MKVVVENLGPVRRAEIDLGKKLIVFAGPNHSGKTHVAWFLYGLMQATLAKGEDSSAQSRLTVQDDLARDLLAAGPTGMSLGDFGDRLERIAVAAMADLVADLGAFFAADSEHFKHTMGHVVALDLAVALRNDPPDFSFRLATEPASLTLVGSTSTDRVVVKIIEVRRESPSPEVISGPSAASDAGLDSDDVARYAGHLAWIVGLIAKVYCVGEEVVILPAERAAITLFSRELSNSVSQRAMQRTALHWFKRSQTAPPQPDRPTSAPYPRPIRDAMDSANSIADSRGVVGPTADLAADLEVLLGGQVQVNAEGEIEFRLDGGGRPLVPFHVSASMVKSLASLVFYLRHQSRGDGTIIIDEPELNLHPDLQRQVARLLAKVANRGVRVIMSTHSDYVLRELSNLVRLGEGGAQGKALAGTLHYDEGSLLRAEDVGVWHFHDGQVDALPLDGRGFNVPSIDAAIDAQNEATLAIELGLDPATPDATTGSRCEA